jgi:hypothetical protein
MNLNCKKLLVILTDPANGSVLAKDTTTIPLEELRNCPAHQNG